MNTVDGGVSKRSSFGKDGRRKKVTYWGAAIARFSWIPMLVVPLIPSLSSSTKWLLIFGFFFLAHSCISCSYVSWLSWISDLVPDDFRGRFFGAPFHRFAQGLKFRIYFLIKNLSDSEIVFTKLIC